MSSHFGNVTPGSSTAYRNGCRCSECSEANTRRVNEWRWKNGARIKGRKPSYETHRMRKAERIAAYEQSPSRCRRCAKPIPYERRTDAHCSVSCARRNERAIIQAQAIALAGGLANGKKRRAAVTDEDFSINVRLSAYRGMARRRGCVFELSRDQFAALVRGACWYCGGSPLPTWRKASRPGCPPLNGIDRIDNSKGYTLENSVPCCGPCNRAKHTMNHEEFISMAKRIAARH